MVPRTMTSTVVASLATAFEIHGVNYAMSSLVQPLLIVLAMPWSKFN
jgi:hypothetical protein